ncbi:MAG TPA: FecR family protein [Devosia sp.]
MGLIVVALAAMFSTSVFADDWVAIKLHGVVLVLVDNDWVKLRRGEAVSDDGVIRTLSRGRVTLQRGTETIELGGDTQVQIIDRTGKKFTTVKQYFGSVSVEADVRKVQHFAVQTPFLAAVVKGTRFTVVSGKDSAKVTVQRGHVAVEDRDTQQSTLLSVGQSASSGNGSALDVAGRGHLPVVYGPEGKPAFASPMGGSAKARATANANGERASANGRSNSGNSNSGNKSGSNSGSNSGSSSSGSNHSSSGNGNSRDSGSSGSGSGNSGSGGSGGSGGGNSGRG